MNADSKAPRVETEEEVPTVTEASVAALSDQVRGRGRRRVLDHSQEY